MATLFETSIIVISTINVLLFTVFVGLVWQKRPKNIRNIRKESEKVPVPVTVEDAIRAMGATPVKEEELLQKAADLQDAARAEAEYQAALLADKGVNQHRVDALNYRNKSFPAMDGLPITKSIKVKDVQTVPICHNCMHDLDINHPSVLSSFPEPCGMCYDSYDSNGWMLYYGLMGLLINSKESAETQFQEDTQGIPFDPKIEALLQPISKAIIHIREHK